MATTNQWPLARAKAKLSELVEEAVNAGPQVITRNGKQKVAVVKFEEFERLTTPKQSFGEFLLNSPLRGTGIRSETQGQGKAGKVLSFLLDTNVLSETAKPFPHPAVHRWILQYGEQLYLSAMTVTELRSGIELMPSGQRKRRLDAWFSGPLMSEFGSRILPMDTIVAEQGRTVLRHRKVERTQSRLGRCSHRRHSRGPRLDSGNSQCKALSRDGNPDLRPVFCRPLIAF